MSILLEALRKSEKSQRSNEVPTIHSDVPGSQASRSFKTGPVIVLLVLTVAVCAWFVWNQYSSPSDIEQLTANGADSLAANDNSPVTETLPTLGRSDRDLAQTSAQDSSETTILKSHSPEPKSSSQPAGQRTPMESYRASEREKRNRAKLAELAVRPSEKPKSSNTYGGAFSSGVKGGSSDTGANDGSDDGTVATAKPYQPDEPQMLGYWDLPDSVRANVPDIKFSVLVYDRNPENRFVLINGERLTEGDSHQPGLVVKEIRRDGVVFSYRLYQFLVEK